jgi:anti-anti-sigma regulatory factor
MPMLVTKAADSGTEPLTTDLPLAAVDFAVSARPASNDVVILDCCGELKDSVINGGGNKVFTDAAEAQINQGHAMLVANLEGAQVDSSGTRALMHVFTLANQKGGGLKLLNPSSQLVAKLNTMKLTTYLSTYDSEEQAVAAYAR